MQPPWAPSLICSITQAAGLESLHVVHWYMWGSKTHRHAPVKAGSVPEMSLTKYHLCFSPSVLCNLMNTFTSGCTHWDQSSSAQSRLNTEWRSMLKWSGRDVGLGKRECRGKWNLFWHSLLYLPVPQDSPAEEHGHLGEAAVLLLLLHHRPDHAAGMGAGPGHPRHVHHRCQVCVAWFVLYDVVSIVGQHHRPDHTAGMGADLWHVHHRCHICVASLWCTVHSCHFLVTLTTFQGQGDKSWGNSNWYGLLCSSCSTQVILNPTTPVFPYSPQAQQLFLLR